MKLNPIQDSSHSSGWLQGSQLHSHAKDLYTMKGYSWSWLHLVREVCHAYLLPHPILLNYPLGKVAFKTLLKKYLVNYWELKLRCDAAPLTSLKYFKPEFMSLTRPPPLLVTARASPYEVTKVGVQAQEIPRNIYTFPHLDGWNITNFFKVSRTWCYSLHHERLKLLCRWRSFCC